MLFFTKKIDIILSRINDYEWTDANIKMNIVSHIVYPIVLAQSANAYRTHKRQVALFNGKQLLLIGLCGALPDLIYPHLALSSRYTSIFHSLWFVAAAFFLAFLLVRKFPKFRSLIYFCWLAACLHLLCDMITGGINLYAPFGNKVIGDSYIPLKYWLSLDVTGVLFLVPAVLYTRNPTRARSFVFVTALAVAVSGASLAFISLDQETFFLKKTRAADLDPEEFMEAERLADDLFAKWQAGSFKSLSSAFADEVRIEQTPERQESDFKRIQRRFGDYQAIIFVELIAARFYFPRVAVFRFKGSFSRMSQQPEIWIVFNSNGKVSDFGIRERFNEKFLY